MRPQLGDEVESERDADDGGHDGDAEQNKEPVVDDAVALVTMLERLSARHRRMPGTGASLHFILEKIEVRKLSYLDRMRHLPDSKRQNI